MCRIFQIFSHRFFRNGIPGRKSLTFHYAILLIEDMLHYWYGHILFCITCGTCLRKWKILYINCSKQDFWKIKSKQTIRYVSQGGTPQISFNWAHFHSKKSPTGPIERTPQPEYYNSSSKQLTYYGGPLGFGPIQFFDGFMYEMDSDIRTPPRQTPGSAHLFFW